MESLDKIKLLFNWEFSGDLSNRIKSYINSLNIQDEIDVYMEVPEGASQKDVGWAFIPVRKVYIRPTKDLEEFELRLAHEITHIALDDEGYRVIVCFDGDVLCSAFANLLHHLILYPRLVAGGFLLEEDTKIVMDGLVNKLQGYKEVSNEHGSDGTAYSIILMINDLIRLQPSKIEEYLSEATKQVPNLLQQAQKILGEFWERKSSATVEDYERFKVILEEELGLDFSFLCKVDLSIDETKED